MFKSAIIEDQSLELQEIQEYPGFITDIDEFSSVLHGFEVDLDGKVVIPRFGPTNYSADFRPKNFDSRQRRSWARAR